MKVALIQINSNEVIEDNFNKFLDFLKLSKEKSVDLIIFPENTFYIGSMKKNREIAILLVKDYWDKIVLAIKEIDIDVILGGVPFLEEKNSKPYNRFFYINKNGKVEQFYDKIHLFKLDNSDSISNEPSFVKAGERVVVFQKEEFTFGFSICYDLRFPELYRELINKKADILLIPAAFTYKTGLLHWEPLLRARAIENQAYILAPNQVGFHGKDGRFGHSYGMTSFVTPKGKITSLDIKNENILIVDIDKEKIKEFRDFLPALENRVL